MSIIIVIKIKYLQNGISSELGKINGNIYDVKLIS